MFIEDEGDGIKSRLPFETFSTLPTTGNAFHTYTWCKEFKIDKTLKLKKPFLSYNLHTIWLHFPAQSGL